MANMPVSISKQTLSKLGVCIGIVVAFVAFLLLPNVMTSKKINKDIVQLQAEIERQKVLYPVYEELKKKLETKHVKELQIAALVPLTEAQINDITTQLEQMGANVGFSVQTVLPDPASLAKETGQLGVSCEMFGTYDNFRKLLLALGGLPSLRHIEKVEVKEAANGVNISMRLQLAVTTG